MDGPWCRRAIVAHSVQWLAMGWMTGGTRDSFSGCKVAKAQADHSPRSSAEVKNVWCYTSTPKYVFMVRCLIKHWDNFTFTLMQIFGMGLFWDQYNNNFHKQVCVWERAYKHTSEAKLPTLTFSICVSHICDTHQIGHPYVPPPPSVK
jgi:hypothetical protein